MLQRSAPSWRTRPFARRARRAGLHLSTCALTRGARAGRVRVRVRADPSPRPTPNPNPCPSPSPNPSPNPSPRPSPNPSLTRCAGWYSADDDPARRLSVPMLFVQERPEDNLYPRP
eukprot:scaffold60916_cov54-Phaeocystis_antarctica.AAC.1